MEQDAISITDAWDGVADCRTCKIRESALFAGLLEKDFEQIHKPIVQTILQPGMHLYHMDKTGDHLYTVRHGMLKLTQFLPDGTQRIVRLARSADLIGQEALLGSPYRHQATALQESEICHIPVSVIEQINKTNPGLHREILSRCQTALKQADDWLTKLSTGTARQRVARFVICITQENPQNQCQLCNREDMGAILGITTESASRVIADFKRKGLLTAVNAHVMICDIAKLQQIANGEC